MANLVYSPDFSIFRTGTDAQSVFLKWGLKPFSFARLSIIFESVDGYDLLRVAHIYLRLGDERVLLRTVKVSAHYGKRPNKSRLLWQYRESLQSRLDEVFCSRQPVPTTIVRND